MYEFIVTRNGQPISVWHDKPNAEHAADLEARAHRTAEVMVHQLAPNESDGWRQEWQAIPRQASGQD